MMKILMGTFDQILLTFKMQPKMKPNVQIV